MYIDPIELLNARKALGLTQKEAGAVVGMSMRGWQDAELGSRHIHPCAWRLFKHLTGLEAIPFGSIRAAGNAKTGNPAGKSPELFASKRGAYRVVQPEG